VEVPRGRLLVIAWFDYAPGVRVGRVFPVELQ